jgi:hypothetical protein
MGKICDKVLCKIKEEKIEPKPRWQFLVKEYLKWSIFAVSVFLGGFAVSFILHRILEHDPDMHLYLHTGAIQYFLVSFPYIWLLIVAILLILVYFNYRHTKNGYCCRTIWVVAGGIAGSVLIGTFLYARKVERPIDNFLGSRVPFYENLFCCHHRRDFWIQPEKGLLGGEIIDLRSKESFSLKDFDGIFWDIENEDGQEIFWRDIPIPQKNIEVKIFGEKKSSHVFGAKEVRPWLDPEDD